MYEEVGFLPGHAPYSAWTVLKENPKIMRITSNYMVSLKLVEIKFYRNRRNYYWKTVNYIASKEVKSAMIKPYTHKHHWFWFCQKSKYFERKIITNNQIKLYKKPGTLSPYIYYKRRFNISTKCQDHIPEKLLVLGETRLICISCKMYEKKIAYSLKIRLFSLYSRGCQYVMKHFIRQRNNDLGIIKVKAIPTMFA